jgi:hypothetical protein
LVKNEGLFVIIFVVFLDFVYLRTFIAVGGEYRVVFCLIRLFVSSIVLNAHFYL